MTPIGQPATTAPAASQTAAPPATSQTATGDQVNDSWSVLPVSVTATGSKITKVGIGTLDDGGNPRSQSVDQHSIPSLDQQAMQAQSAGLRQSRQSALTKVNIR